MPNTDSVNILLVDDQPSKLLSYEAILSELGENLIQAGSAREALERLLKYDIAVVLIDVIMPELDGFELAAMVRAHPRFQNIPMIFVSALAQSDLDRVRGYEQGAVDYVPVPVVPELLRAKVRVFAELYRKTRQLELLNAELERRVEERTAELARANADLEQRVEERTREREKALAQVHEMQKLESLGQLTGGVAHDFNNLLTTILSNLDLLSKKHGNDPTSGRLLGGAIRSAERGASLTKRMLAFARKQELRPAVFDPAKLIAGMEDMLKASLGPSIRITSDLGPIPYLIRADPNQLELAILNLALNARDAMPRGGDLVIKLRAEKVDASAQPLSAGDYVCISIIDTGTGMDEVTLKRAAEPFFTTKGVAKGTGLGLSMVYGLVAQSDGWIRMSSQPGHGTTVELFFPLSKSSPPAKPAREMQTTAIADMPKCILVVDDEVLVAESISEMLSDLGHTVHIAYSGALALELVHAHTEIELVLTDHAMPGMTGVELASAIRKFKPNLPIVLGSGYAGLPEGTDLQLPRLSKPYRQDDLRSLIASIIWAK
ncbi:MAG: response regulator [Methylocella sp.]|nr:MAG: hybrid sensor histidine kinase/response regulator [Hyphomicrobiales bacterium]